MDKYKNKNWLYQKYIVEELSSTKIAKICKCSSITIRNWLNKYNIRIRTKSEITMGKLNPAFRPLEERFWEKVDKNGPDGCWIWIVSLNSNGYGQIFVDGKKTEAHIVSWKMYNNKKIPNGCVIHHKCHNPKCVNPNHLQCISKKQHIIIHHKNISKNIGENHPRSKLKAWQVLEIRTKYATKKYTYKQLATEYNVKYSTIYSIINRKTWKHI